MMRMTTAYESFHYQRMMMACTFQRIPTNVQVHCYRKTLQALKVLLLLRYHDLVRCLQAVNIHLDYSILQVVNILFEALMYLVFRYSEHCLMAVYNLANCTVVV
jgi:hypothetical protein